MPGRRRSRAQTLVAATEGSARARAVRTGDHRDGRSAQASHDGTIDRSVGTPGPYLWGGSLHRHPGRAAVGDRAGRRGQEFGAQAHGRLPARRGQARADQRAEDHRRRHHGRGARRDGRRGGPGPPSRRTGRDHPGRTGPRGPLRAGRADAGVGRRARSAARPVRTGERVGTRGRRLRAPAHRHAPARARDDGGGVQLLPRQRGGTGRQQRSAAGPGSSATGWSSSTRATPARTTC